MGQIEVEVGTLKRGRKCWFEGQQWEVVNEGNRYIHLVNDVTGHVYIEQDELVEIE